MRAMTSFWGFLGGAPIDQVVQRQRLKSSDIHEAELHAFTTACHRIVPLRGKIHECRVRQLAPALLYSDSDSVIKVAKNLQGVKRSLWTLRRAQVCHETYEMEEMFPLHIAGGVNLADIGTKYLKLEAWRKFIEVILNFAARKLK